MGKISHLPKDLPLFAVRTSAGVWLLVKLRRRTWTSAADLMHGFWYITVPVKDEAAPAVLARYILNRALNTTAANRSQFGDAPLHLWQRLKLLCQAADTHRDPASKLHVVPHSLVWQWLGPKPWDRSQCQARQSAVETVCAIKSTSPASSKGKGAGQMDVFRGTVSSTAPTWIMLVALPESSLNSGMRAEDTENPHPSQHRKVTYLTYSTILIPA